MKFLKKLFGFIKRKKKEPLVEEQPIEEEKPIIKEDLVEQKKTEPETDL